MKVQRDMLLRKKHIIRNGKMKLKKVVEYLKMSKMNNANKHLYETIEDIIYERTSKFQNDMDDHIRILSFSVKRQYDIKCI